jgi:large subunit ribosomal protein L27
MGTDHTIFAVIEGNVAFRAKANGRMYVSVAPKSNQTTMAVAAE